MNELSVFTDRIRKAHNSIKSLAEDLSEKVPQDVCDFDDVYYYLAESRENLRRAAKELQIVLAEMEETEEQEAR